MSERIFLRAQWLNLAMLNFDADPQILLPLIPRGVELDEFEGRTLISLVAFEFARARLLGISIPFHQLFPELNLRCYVRRRVGGEMRRGVVFLKEIVPRRAVVWTANRLFNESFTFAPMSHRCGAQDVAYEVRYGGRVHRVRAAAAGESFIPPADSQASFVVEHYFAYNVSQGGETLEFRVAHPRWKIRRAARFEIDIDAEQLYGPRLARFLAREPTSAFLADGSEVCVYRGTPIPWFHEKKLNHEATKSNWSSVIAS